jgi:DNA-binding transcriptional LysR family regulator
MLSTFAIMPTASCYSFTKESLRLPDLGFVCFRGPPPGGDLQGACVGQDLVLAVVPAESPLARKVKIELKALEAMFFVGLSEKTYPGSNAWLTEACREAGFTPRILQEADREPAVMSFVAAGLGVALLPEQLQRLPHEGVSFLPLRRRLTAESWAVWKASDASGCLKEYLRIVKELSKRAEGSVG